MGLPSRAIELEAKEPGYLQFIETIFHAVNSALNSILQLK